MTRRTPPGRDLGPRLRGTARWVWERQRARADRRAREIPPFAVHPASGPPSVYYLVPEPDRPHGGIRVAYRHVDLLNELGWSAAVLNRRGERVTWFENTTRVVGVSGLRFGADDLLVVPEWYGASLSRLDPRVRVLVFNQGAYLTFDGLSLDGTERRAPYADVTRLEGILTVSQDSARLLRLAFPDVPLDIARPVVDPALFSPGAVRGGRSIAYVPTRRHGELNHLLHMFRAVGIDWPLRPITGLSEVQVGEAMRASAIFLSLSERDGFGLPPAEAMACGAYVIGYTGGGGREYLDAAYSRPVEDSTALVRAVQDAVAQPFEQLVARGRAAAHAIHARYHAQGLREDLLRVYGPLLEEPHSVKVDDHAR